MLELKNGLSGMAVTTKIEMYKRNFAIDGLRGLCALAVVVFHFIPEFWKGILSKNIENFVHYALNGHAAVCIFFVISGYALKLQSLAVKSIYDLVILTLKRYFRLSVTVWFSVIILLILVLFDVIYWSPFVDAGGRRDWFEYPIYGAYGEYIEGGLYQYLGKGYASLNPFLWPLKYEFYCAIFIYIEAIIFNKIKNQYFVYFNSVMAAAFAPFNYFVSLFLFGAVIATLDSFKLKYGIAVLVGCTAIAGLFSKDWFYTILPISVVLYVTIFSGATVNYILGMKPFLYLGKLSYQIYVLHFTILISATSYFGFLFLRGDISTGILIVLNGVTFPLLLVVSGKIEKIERKILTLINGKINKMAIRITW